MFLLNSPVFATNDENLEQFQKVLWTEWILCLSVRLPKNSPGNLILIFSTIPNPKKVTTGMDFICLTEFGYFFRNFWVLTDINRTWVFRFLRLGLFLKSVTLAPLTPLALLRIKLPDHSGAISLAKAFTNYYRCVVKQRPTEFHHKDPQSLNLALLENGNQFAVPLTFKKTF
jgi:hypothetical protein